MEYSRFVRLRRPLWDELAQGLDRLRRRRPTSHAELERLALLYRRALHDHALAGERFPGTGAARRLHRLVLDGTRQLVHRERPERRGAGHFFLRTFPASFRRHLGPTGLAAALFAAAAVLGLGLAAVRPGLGTAFLGPQQVADLERGTLWTESLVTTTPPSVSSSRIATNNLGVALGAWGGGALAGMPTLYIVLLNGFHLGSILGITAHYSMAEPLLAFVAAHGVLEITLILVAAGAGLGLARALAAPGERPRAEAVGEAARDSLRLLLGCLPWFVLLALVETLVSPAPELDAWTKLVLGLGLELLFLLIALAPGRALEEAG